MKEAVACTTLVLETADGISRVCEIQMLHGGLYSCS